MTADKYKEGDRIFAKMKGYPAWPAMVKDRIPGKVESYSVFFYGTYESAKLKPDCIYPYNDETKARYGKAQRKVANRFKEALDEIEQNIAISTLLLNNQPPPPLDQMEDIGDDEEGGLIIDESPTPPPVLKREGKSPVAATAKKSVPKKEVKPPVTPAAEAAATETVEQLPTSTPSPLAKQPRRVSKANKRDSNLAPATPPPEVVTPVAPQLEIVSRSGRKIKPKRFADEDVQFATSTSSKPSPTSEDGKSFDTAPAKRAKRVTSVGVKTQAAATAKTEVKSLPPPPPLERPKLVPARNSKKKSIPANTNLTTMTPTRPPPPLRAMPNLIPAPTSSPPSLIPIESEDTETTKAEIVDPEPTPTEELRVNTADLSEAPIPEKPEESSETAKGELDAPKEDEDSLSSKGEDDSSTSESPDDREKSEPQETDDEGTGKENNLQDEEEVSGNYENGIGEDSDEAPSVPKRMKVDLKSGAASIVLSFNHDRPTSFRSDLASVEYDMATARSVLQTKTQLEVNETDFLKTISDSIELKDDKAQLTSKTRIDQVQKKVLQLRMEGEIVEIIGELVGCLGMKFAYCDRALDLLDKLGSRTDINPLALKKNPEVVDVIRKVQNYHGNVSQWTNFSQAKIDDFHMKAELIREKAVSIYQSFKLLFCTTPGKSFYDTFSEEIEKFTDSVSGVPEASILGIFDDPAPSPQPEKLSAPPSPLLSSLVKNNKEVSVGSTNGTSAGDEADEAMITD